MKKLYPLTFKTIFKEKIWGGEKIKSVLKKDYSPFANCGETWELSAVHENESVVANGEFEGKTLTQLIQHYKGDLLGESVYKSFGNHFPLLIKFIDAQQDLSVQVHPDDELARALHGDGASGKTEMWYIMQADEGASLIAGFSEKVDKDSFKTLIEEGQLERVLNRVPVEKGDVFFIPAGRVHTIGKGILLAEIQQTSDITYRLYDFDRKDAQGNKRELHVDNALKALDFNLYETYKTSYEHIKNTPNNLVDSPFFTTNKWLVDKETTVDYNLKDSFIIYICVEGSMHLKCDKNEYQLNKGDVYLLPASCNMVSLNPNNQCEFLEVYINN